MSELSLSNAKKPCSASFDILSESINVLFFLLSNPLYFSYFIFFSPYLYKLFSFLSPLFITTTLLVFAFLSTLSPSLVHDRDRDRDHDHDHDQHFEEFEVYKIVFEYSPSPILEIKEDQHSEVLLDEVVKETCSEDSVEKRLIVLHSLSPKDEALSEEEEEEEDEFENESRKKEDSTITKVKAWNNDVEELEKVGDTKAGKEGNKVFESEAKPSSDSTYIASPELGFDDKHSIEPINETDGSDNLGSFGSMRREKEWTRTLACKLFEERHNSNASGGTEGMDSLWETYETESNYKSQGNEINKMRKNSTKKGKKSLVDQCSDYNNDDDDDDYEDDEGNGQLCCLQALKFSAGKVNYLGMGKPNLVKFSKAFKGIGWIHNVARNSKKRNNKD